MRGVLNAEYENTGAHIDVVAPLQIGRHINPNGWDYYAGGIDQLLIYDRALLDPKAAIYWSSYHEARRLPHLWRFRALPCA